MSNHHGGTENTEKDREIFKLRVLRASVVNLF
jgi:hypothetical protein